MFNYLKKGWEYVSRIFGNNPKVRPVLILFVVLIVLSYATKCRGADFEFEAGNTIVRGPAPTIAFNVLKSGCVDRADCTLGLQLVGDSTWRGEHIRNQMAIQGQIVNGFKRIDLGIGAAYLQNEDEYNSCHFEFSLLAQWRIDDHWRLAYRHWSNAGTCPHNVGRDFLLIGYKF